MIVCSCNFINQSEIEKVIRDFLAEDCWRLITPGLVYAAMAKRGKCCGCFPNVINVIIATTREYHRQQDTPEAQVLPFISRIVEEHRRCDTIRQLSAVAKQRRNVA